MAKILITSALPYVNNVPHLGHIVGCHLPADIFYRFNKAIGNETYFIGGADEHGTATLISANTLGISPDKLCYKLSELHKKMYDKLNISYNLFSGTHTKYNEETTIEFYKELDKNGYIEERDDDVMLYCENEHVALADRYVKGVCPYCGYEDAYGDQCDACGKTYDITELKEPKCRFCGEPATFKKTKHLYLRLDKLQDKLDAYIESRKDIWRPTVYKEAKRWINEGLKPRCITRDIPWGIKVPREGFEDKVFYVWFDAPIGYISITKELGGEKLVKELWQSEDCKIYNFIGKDNIPFHSVFFPAMEIGCGKYNLAYNVVGFNFMNFEGQKFSKSKNVGVFCDGLLDSDIDIDALRAYLVTMFPENKDTDFRWDGLKDNTNSELVGKFGNFFNRTLNMIWKNFEGKLNFELTDSTPLDENDKEMIKAIEEYPDKIASLLENTEFREAYKKVMEFATVGNGYLEKVAPWTLIKNGDIEGAKKVLYLCLNMAKALCIVAHPFIPARTEEIWNEQLNFQGNLNDQGFWKEAKRINIKASHYTRAPKPIFARIDDEKLEEYKAHFSKHFDLFSLKD